MVVVKPLPTIWDVPDGLGQRIEPVILELDPPKSKGRIRVDQRKMLQGIIFRMRSGCQWNHLPRELGDDSKKPANYLGLLQLACSLIWYRRLTVLR